MIKEAIILAGGFGTRLTSVKDIPKPMAPINNIPFLEYILNYLSSFNILTVHLAVGYKKELIINYFGHQFKSISLNYVLEEDPLGTGGAIKKALLETKSSNILILNGDTFFQLGIEELGNFHLLNNSDVTIALKPMIKFDRYGTVLCNNESRVINFSEKQFCDKGLINGGVYVLKSDIFDKLQLPDQFSLEKDFFEKYYTEKKMLGFISDTYFIDIGIPSDYEKAKLTLPKLK